MHSPSSDNPNSDSPKPAPRRSVRLMVQLDTTLDDGKVARMFQTENVSKSGMLVRTRAPLPVGTKVAIQFLFPGDPVFTEDELPGGYAFVEGAAKVVRHTAPEKEDTFGMGLSFVSLEEKGRQLLGKLLDIHKQSQGPSAVPA